IHLTITVASLKEEIAKAINPDLKFLIQDKSAGNVTIVASDDNNDFSNQSDPSYNYQMMQEFKEYPFLIQIGYNRAADLYKLLYHLTVVIAIYLVLGLLALSIERSLYKKSLTPLKKLAAADEGELVNNKESLLGNNIPPALKELAERLSETILAKVAAEKKREQAEIEAKVAVQSLTAITAFLEEYGTPNSIQENIEKILLDEFLNQCINVFSYKAFLKNVELTSNAIINHLIPYDPVIKQMILCFIKALLDTSFHGERILIEAFLDEKLILKISKKGEVHDLGIGVGEVNIKNMVTTQPANKVIESNIASALELLIELQGTLSLQHQIGEGTEFMITIPFDKRDKVEQDIADKSALLSSNIINFCSKAIKTKPSSDPTLS
ncbi:MAG: ATP-binding protein, partial [Burkholderiales bacterium]